VKVNSDAVEYKVICRFFIKLLSVLDNNFLIKA
jgi:hypothetical protein